MNTGSNYLTVESPLSWDQYFMLQAMLASYKSKDPSTKVGCVFVDKKNHQISMGYNGFVAGIDEKKLPWGKDQNQSLSEQKYSYVVHAEANAIIHAPASLETSRCYVTLFPCNECAKLLASLKVSEIIYLSDKHAKTESTQASKRLLDLASIRYRQLSIEANLIEVLADAMSLQADEALIN